MGESLDAKDRLLMLLAPRHRPSTVAPRLLHTAHMPRLALFLLAALFAAVCIGSALSPTLTALAVAAILLIAAIVLYPTAGLCVLLALIMVQESPLYLQHAVFGSRAFTLVDIVGVITLGSLGLHLLFGQSRSRPPRPALLALLAISLFYGWLVLSVAWSPADVSTNISSIRNYAELVGGFALTIVLIRRTRDVRIAAAVYAAAATGLGIYTILTFRSHLGFTAGGYTYTLAGFRGGLPVTLNANIIAVVIALGPPFAVIATRALSRAAAVCTVTVVTAISLVSIVILSSRTAILASACGLLAALLLARGARARVAVLCGGVTLLALVGLADVTHHVPYYFDTILSSTTSSQIGGRAPTWQAGLQVFAQNPLFGLGNYGFETVAPALNVNTTVFTDSMLIESLANGGLVAFVLYIVMLAALAQGPLAIAGRDAMRIVIVTIVFVSALAQQDFQGTYPFLIALGILFAPDFDTKRAPAASDVPGVPRVQALPDPRAVGRAPAVLPKSPRATA